VNSLLKARIRNFPVSFFAVSMGLTGCLIALQKVGPILGLSPVVAKILLDVALVVFSIIAIAYSSKIAINFSAFRADLNHPVRMHFLPTFSVSLLLLAIATMGPMPILSRYFWMIGTVAHLVLTLYTLTIWLQHSHFKIHHANPSWFIPILGNLVVPVAGAVHAPVFVNWFFLCVGLFFWVLLFAVLLNRLIFHEPIQDKLVPTFSILMAPPAIGFISYVKLTGKIDLFAMGLYSLALFLFLFVCAQWQLFRKIRFYLSWWAYSFPLAAMDLATVLLFHKTGNPALKTFGLALFFGLVLLVVFLTALTVKDMTKGQICIEE
jgi:tellurite resistance protein